MADVVCARDGVPLEGYGVLWGLLVHRLDEFGAATDSIFCPSCRDLIVAGSAEGPEEACSMCREPLGPRSLVTAVLAADASGFYQFCYTNGHAALVADRMTPLT